MEHTGIQNSLDKIYLRSLLKRMNGSTSWRQEAKQKKKIITEL